MVDDGLDGELLARWSNVGKYLVRSSFTKRARQSVVAYYGMLYMDNNNGQLI